MKLRQLLESGGRFQSLADLIPNPRFIMHKLFFFPFLVVGSLLTVGCKSDEDIALEEQEAEKIAAAKAVVANQPPMPDQEAAVGVGLKGNSLDDIGENDPRGIIAYPAIAYFKTKEKIVFEIQLPHACNIWEAINGRNPRNHEEYMRVIVDENKIKLPELPYGMVYEYRPDTNKLWVVAEKK
jgi:hypothetical protein